MFYMQIQANLLKIKNEKKEEDKICILEITDM